MKNKTYRFAVAAAILLALALVFAAPVGAADAWDGTSVDNSWYIETSTEFTILDAADLAYLAQLVNGGTEFFEGKTIKLGADIDLNNKEWTPIGSASVEHGFMGNFDGDGHKILNLNITNPTLDNDGYAYAGLFGVTEGTDANNQNFIKNLTIENVNIDTTGHIVSAAIAYPHYTIVDNITVCGDIKITGGNYTSGVLAYTRRCVDASNLYVVGNEGSTITGKITVGGVISDIQMNGGLTADYSNFGVQGVTITGEQSVGGISGIIAAQTLTNAKVENVVLVSSTDDSRVGVVSGSLGGPSTITGITVTNVDGASSIIGGAYYGGKPVEAKIGDTYYSTLQAALDAADAGDTVTLLSDVTLSTYITIEDGDDITIEGNGKTITRSDGTGFYVTGGKLTLGEGLTVKASDMVIFIVGGEVITSANLESTSNECSIIGNGNYEGKVTINGGSVSSKEIAIYWPQNGVLTINGGTITGQTAVYFKSGSLTITGGELVGNGEEAEYAYVSSGCNPTGDALVIENVGGKTGYEAISSVSITGGTFTSKNADAVGSYAATSENADAQPVTAFITGGTFSSDVSAYVAEGYHIKQVNDAYKVTNKWTVTFNSNGGSDVGTIEIENDGKVTQPDNPTKSGFTFSKWMNGETEWDFENEVVTSDLVLNATWTENKKPSSSSSSSSSSSNTQNDSVEEPETPVEEPVAGETTVETEVTDGGEVALETPSTGGSAAAADDSTSLIFQICFFFSR